MSSRGLEGSRVGRCSARSRVKRVVFCCRIWCASCSAINEARQAGIRKASLPVGQMLLRGALAGVFLGYATSLAMQIVSQGSPPILGAICFPVGFVMLVLLGLELATGNFALLPIGYATGEVQLG